MSMCPDDAVIAAFCEGTLHGAALERIEHHIDRCTTCSLLVGQVNHGTATSSSASSRLPDPIARWSRACELKIGQQVGRYEVRGHVASGGMGSVFLAHDPQLQRDVAIKVLHDGFGFTHSHSRRILREGRLMARLSHRHVLPVYDVGVDMTDDGERVYIATAFIEGRNLRQWADVQPRSWRSICEVFIGAGEGLAAAHAADVIHRDFKPENVMLDEADVPYVVDFGLAMQERSEPQPSLEGSAPPDSDGAASTTLRTVGIVGTPLYMAPEQHAGHPATAAADQYAFCLSLYELLFGELPFRGTSSAGLAAAKLRGIDGFPRRSNVPKRLYPILRRGLAADPAERWPSMQALVDRLRQRSQRRSYFVLGTSATAVAVGCVGTGALWHSRAERCSGAVEAIADAWGSARQARLEEAFRRSELVFAPSATQRVVARLDAWASEWVQVHEQTCHATRISGEQSESVMDLRMSCLARAKLGLVAAVDVLSEGSSEAVENADSLVDALPSLTRCSDVEALRAGVAPPSLAEAEAVEGVMAQVAEARAQRQAGLLDLASGTLAETALEVAQLAYEPAHVEVWLEQAMLDSARGDQVAAAAGLRKVQEAATRLHDWSTMRVVTVALISVLGYSQARPTEAFALRELALGLASTGDASEKAEVHNALGLVSYIKGDYAAAETEHRQALSLRLKRFGPHHRDVASSRNNLAMALVGQGKRSEAEAQYRESLAAAETLLGVDHPDVAAGHKNLANLLFEQGRHEDGIAEVRLALAVEERVLPPEHPALILSRINLATMLGEYGQHDEAEAGMRNVLELRRKVLGELHPDVAVVHNNLGVLLRRKGEPVAALAEHRRALEIRTESLGVEHPSVATSRLNIGSVLLDEKRYAEAEAELTAAAELIETSLGPEHPYLISAFGLLGRLFVARGEPRQAIPYFERAYAVCLAADASKPHLADAAFSLAQALLTQGARSGSRRRALELARQALAIHSKRGDVKQQALVEDWLREHE